MSRLHLILDESSLAASGTGFVSVLYLQVDQDGSAPRLTRLRRHVLFAPLQLSQNTGLLGGYDILSVQPTTAATLAMACLAMATPGPNQVGILLVLYAFSSA